MKARFEMKLFSPVETIGNEVEVFKSSDKHKKSVVTTNGTVDQRCT